MLEVKDLHCSYGTTQVLKGVDIRVNNGEVISILCLTALTHSFLFSRVSLS